VTLELAPSRERARALILAGDVLVGTQRVEKAGQLLPGDAVPTVKERPRFVGRGGEKLAGALAAFGVNVDGVVGLDVGASTGGFTDCLLQGGAKRVYAVDVGRGQLAERLRNDARVISMEKLNARYAYDLPERADIAVVDVSFISVRLVLAETIGHLKPGSQILALVKPQFEAGKERVGRNGVVSDSAVHAAVLSDVCLWVVAQPTLQLLGIRRSVLVGDKGNREFFVHLRVLAD
jgi:23S rRNA (cytidine1920-2'-O)/16S rRNA (cytidine1409-2'-O)-methyltransferase